MTYQDHLGPGGEVTHSWDAFTLQRLTWLYGEKRARSIVSGCDFTTQADVTAWLNLGKQNAA